MPITGSDLFGGRTSDPYLLAARAYVWGYAPVLAARLRRTLTDPLARRPPTSAGAPLNNMGHQRELSNPTLLGIAPNVDTLYSLAWLDLADEPFILESPDFGDRYYTFQIGHADTAADISVGARTHGRRLPPIVISGPRNRTPRLDGMLHARSHTRYVLIAGRILVRPDDPADHEVVFDLQSRIRLRPLSRHLSGGSGANPAPAQRPVPERSGGDDSSLAFLDELGTVLRDWDVRPEERALVGSFARIGLTPANGFSAGALDARARRRVARGIADGETLVESKTRALGRNVNGWTINHDGPRFADDYLLRAAVARKQVYVTVPEEALYPVASVDADGRPLSGEHAYRLVFAPRARPPVDGFWSITVYRHDPHPLVPNPIGRYAIGDRTAGLVARPDGSLVIRIQHEQPADPHTNWLPAPRGPFHLMLRLYVPRPSVLDGTWLPPPIERDETARD